MKVKIVSQISVMPTMQKKIVNFLKLIFYSSYFKVLSSHLKMKERSIGCNIKRRLLRFIFKHSIFLSLGDIFIVINLWQWSDKKMRKGRIRYVSYSFS